MGWNRSPRVTRTILVCAALVGAVSSVPSPGYALELTLEETRALAREAAFEVEIMQARIDALQATQREAGATLRPRVQVSGRLEQRDREVAIDLPELPGFDIGSPVVIPGSQALVMVEFDAPIVNLDGWSRVRAARQQVAAGRAQLSVVIDRVELTAIEVHIGVLSLEAALEVAQDRGALAAAYRDSVMERLRVGMATDFELRRAETEVVAARIQVEEIRRARADALRMLGVLVGGEDVTAVAAPGETPQTPPGSLDEQVARALAERPELHVHSHTLSALEAAGDGERLGLIPDLIVSGQASTSTAESIDGQHAYWALQANLVWVPYDRGLRRSRQARAAAQTRGQEAELARTVATIEREVSDAWFALESTQATAALAAEQEHLAGEALRLAELAQEAGAATALDVLEARASFVNARTQSVSASHRRDLAVWRLIWSIGAL